MSRAYKKQQTIASSADFLSVAKKASWANPAHCTWLDQDQHRDFSLYLNQFYSQQKGYSDTEGTKVNLARLRWLNFGIGEENGVLVAHPDEVWFRESYDKSEPW